MPLFPVVHIVTETFSKKKNKFRFEFAAQNRDQILNRTAKYAVKYFYDQDFYILWKVNSLKSEKESCYRTVFSIDRDEAIKAYNANILGKKSVEFEWKFKEDVLITDFEGLKNAVANIVK